MEKKKDGKIIKQIAGFIYVITALTVVLAGAAMYGITITRYNKRVREDREETLRVIYENIKAYAADEWLWDYYETHWEDFSPPDNSDAYLEYQKKLGEILGDHSANAEEFWVMLQSVTEEELEKLAPEEQKIYAEFVYVEWLEEFSISQIMSRSTDFSCVNFKSPGDGAFVFFKGDYEKDEDNFAQEKILGTRLTYHPTHHVLVEQMLATGSEGTVFENYTSSVDHRRYTGIYLPFVYNGKVRCTLVATTAMSEGVMQSLDTIRTTFAVLLVAMWGMMTIAMLFLQKMLIIPIERMQQSLKNYTQNWNKKEITEELKRTRLNNEMGQLSDDLVLLADELEGHTKRLVALTAEKERMSVELDIAAKIQSGVLPQVFPAFPDRTEFDIFASMTPAKEIGGDFYDFFLTDEDHLALVIGDVSGKGVPAALFMITVKALIKNAVMSGSHSPAEVLSSVSDTMEDGNEECMFVTVWLGLLTISTGEMVCASAGHDCPAICKKGGDFALYDDPHGVPVGILRGEGYEDYPIHLGAGDTLFVYTDGVPEAQDRSEAQFGEERLLTALNEVKDGSPEAVIRHIKAQVDAFAKGRNPFDDITMLCIKMSEL